MLTMAEIAVLVVAFFATRLPFVLSERGHNTSSDRQVYLWYLGLLSRGMALRDRRFANGLIADRVPIPIIPHWLVARFPASWHAPIMVSLNLVSDAVLLGLFGWVLASQSLVPFDGQLVWPLLLLAASPLLHPPGARLNSFGGRVYANLLFFAFFLALFHTPHSPAATAAALGAALLTLNASVFGSQALFFFSLALSVWRLDPWPLGIFSAAMAVTWFSPWGGGVQWRGRFAHYAWYLRFMTRKSRLSWRRHWEHLRSGDPLKVISGLLVSNPWTAVALMFPPLFLLFSSPDPSAPAGMIYAWQIGRVGLGLLVFCTFYPGAVWGESERYVEMTVPFVLAGLFALPGFMDQGTMVLLAVWSFALCSFNLLAYEGKTVAHAGRHSHYEDLQGIRSFLSASSYRNILTQPLKLGYLFSNLMPEKHFFLFNYDLKEGFGYYFKYMEGGMYNLKDDPGLWREAGMEVLVGKPGDIQKLPRMAASCRKVYADAEYEVWELPQEAS